MLWAVCLAVTLLSYSEVVATTDAWKNAEVGIDSHISEDTRLKNDDTELPTMAPAPFSSLAIVMDADSLLNATALTISRIVSAKSGCRVSLSTAGLSAAGPNLLRLTLRINASLGPEAYSASYDHDRSTAVISGGDRMGVTFGAGAFLRAAQYRVKGLVPPQAVPLPPPPPPPPPPSPPAPIIPGYWATAENVSIVFGVTGPAGNGTTVAPLLGVFTTFDECKHACTSAAATASNQCTAVSWAGLRFEHPFENHCYSRHDTGWQPHIVIGITSARRFKLPLPLPPPPPPPPPPPGPPTPTRAWDVHGAPVNPGSFRGLYMASHYGNFFANAPHDAIREYLEDVALWGANTLVLIAEPANWADYPSFEPLLDRNAQIGVIAQQVGLKVGWIFINEGFRDDDARHVFPKAKPTFDYSPNMHLVCPAKGQAYLEEIWGRILRRVRTNGLSLDHLIAWPYDWGGCGCEQDWPW
jgi:hypothetical protein